MMQSQQRLALINVTSTKLFGVDVSVYYAFEDPTNTVTYYSIENFNASNSYDVNVLNYNAIAATRYVIGSELQKIRVITMETIISSLKDITKRKPFLKELIPFNTRISTEIATIHDNIAKHKSAGKVIVKYVGDIETSTGIYDTFVDSDGEFFHLVKDITPIFANVMSIKGTEGRVIIDGVYVNDSLISHKDIMAAIGNIPTALAYHERVKSKFTEISFHYVDFEDDAMPVLEPAHKPNLTIKDLNEMLRPKPEIALRALVDDWIQTHPVGNLTTYDYNVKFMIDCALTLKAHRVDDKIISSGTTFSCESLSGVKVIKGTTLSDI